MLPIKWIREIVLKWYIVHSKSKKALLKSENFTSVSAPEYFWNLPSALWHTCISRGNLVYLPVPAHRSNQNDVVDTMEQYCVFLNVRNIKVPGEHMIRKSRKVRIALRQERKYILPLKANCFWFSLLRGPEKEDFAQSDLHTNVSVCDDSVWQLHLDFPPGQFYLSPCH